MRYQTSRISDKERPDIAQFFKKYGLGDHSYGSMDYFYWKIDSNPVAGGFINVVKIDGELASTASMTPRRLYLHGRPVNAAELGDSCTAVPHYRKGLFALLSRTTSQAMLDQGFDFVYGLPNLPALKGHVAKANYRVLQGLNVGAYSLPLSAKNKLQGKLGWVAAQLLSGLYPVFMRIKSWASKPNAKVREKYAIAACENIPTGWDEFIDGVQANHDFILDRHETAIHWRFFKHPETYDLYVIRHNETIVGYFVLRNIPTELGPAVNIADLLVDKVHEPAIDVAISFIIARALERNGRSINTWCVRDSAVERSLKKRGFRRDRDVPIIMQENELVPDVEAIKTPYFSMSDSDNV